MVHGEVISLHIGQAGIQAGHSFWVQLCAEHGIAPDGVPFRPKCDPNEFAESLFTHSSKDTYSPRAFCIDTDPGSLDWIKLSDYRELYNPGQLITGLEDAGGCFARGYHHFGRNFTRHGKERIRRVLENCDLFQGFMVFRSLTGGTGSGLSSILMRKMNDEFAKHTVLSLDILPTFQGGSALDPYNVVLALHETKDTSDVSFLFSNQSLFRIARNHMGIKHPTFRHVNQVIASVASQVSNGYRFKSDLSLTLSELETNLVPLPRMKYPVLAYSPLCPPGRSVSNIPMSTLINNLFTKDALVVPCDVTNGRYISALLLLRGDFQPNDVNEYINRLINVRNSPVRFVDWIPASMKYTLCSIPPLRPFGGDLGHVPRSAVAAMNQTGMEPVLRPYLNSFRKMYCNKAFLHLYKQEGMDEQDFEEALEDMLALQEDFQMVAKDENPNSVKEKKCVQISVPEEAILKQRETQGRCGPCQKLNVELKAPLKVQECDPGCGLVPTAPWVCVKCTGRPLGDMTLYGRTIGKKYRPPCKPVEDLCARGNNRSLKTSRTVKTSSKEIAKKKSKCAICIGPICCKEITKE